MISSWRRLSTLPRTTVSTPLREWLTDPASLTRRLQQRYDGNLQVALRSLGWERPLPDERRALGLRNGQYALIRQVHLICDDRPRVFARSVIPAATLRGSGRRLAKLGTRPLGAFLFAAPGTVRGAVEAAALERGTLLWRYATEGVEPPPERIWGRRSVFRLRGKPLLVMEAFLPELFA